MSQQGNVRLVFVITAPQSEVAEGDRLFNAHAAWMASTHHRSGEKALLSYDVSKTPELSNPMDVTSAPTGKTCFVLAEMYESVAGVADHYRQAQGWAEFPAFGAWIGKCQVTIVSAAPIAHSLW